MRTLRYKVGELASVIIPLGIQGEREALTVEIDMTEWMADGNDGQPVITAINPKGVVYPVANTAYDSETWLLSWVLGAQDTAEYGNGAVEVSLYQDGTITKSQKARTGIVPSFYKGLGEPPDAYEVWLERVTEMGAGAAADRINAARSAAAAAESEANAAASRDEAAAIVEAMQQAASGQAILTEKVDIEIPADSWTADGEGYSWTMERATITAGTLCNLCIDETILHLTSCIEWETSAGLLTLTTSRRPSGTIAGYALLLTVFEDSDEVRDTTLALLSTMQAAVRNTIEQTDQTTSAAAAQIQTAAQTARQDVGLAAETAQAQIEEARDEALDAIDQKSRESLPIATANAVGAVKAGIGLNVAEDGTLSATAQIPRFRETITGDTRKTYLDILTGDTAAATEVPLAASSRNGMMSAEDKAKLDAFGAASTYATQADLTGHTHAAESIISGMLPAARIGELPASKIASGTLDAARLPIATASTAGIVKVGYGLAINDGVLRIDLPEAEYEGF